MPPQAACVCRITVQQIRSPMRRDCTQRLTLIGLKLNKIGRFAELPDTPETRGMIAKVAHLVRIIGQETELDCFVRLVRAEYHELITTRIHRGEVLWAQFEAAVEACRADPKSDDRQITEKVNEMAVAKVLLVDQAMPWPITYEPNLLPDGRKIDFVVDRGADNLYVEVKTVRPRATDTDAAWERFLARRRRHPENVQVILEKDWGAPSTATCSRRAHIFSTTRWILRSASRRPRRSSRATASSYSVAPASPGISRIWKTSPIFI